MNLAEHNKDALIAYIKQFLADNDINYYDESRFVSLEKLIRDNFDYWIKKGLSSEGASEIALEHYLYSLVEKTTEKEKGTGVPFLV